MLVSDYKIKYIFKYWQIQWNENRFYNSLRQVDAKVKCSTADVQSDVKDENELEETSSLGKYRHIILLVPLIFMLIGIVVFIVGFGDEFSMAFGSIFFTVSFTVDFLLFRNIIAQRKLGKINIRIKPSNPRPGESATVNQNFRPQGRHGCQKHQRHTHRRRKGCQRQQAKNTQPYTAWGKI